MTSIRPVLAAADASLAMDVKKQATIGHLRAVARHIAQNLHGTMTETAEVVRFQNCLEDVFLEYCRAMSSPVNAVAYTSPDAVAALITASSPSESLPLPKED